MWGGYYKMTRTLPEPLLRGALAPPLSKKNGNSFPPAPFVAPRAKADHAHGGGSLAEPAGGLHFLLTVRTLQKQLAKLLGQLFFELAQSRRCTLVRRWFCSARMASSQKWTPSTAAS